MPHSVDPKQTTRASAYEFWMKAPNPMVTFIKTIDVTRLVRVSKRNGLKFNMLLDWCIGKAASPIKEFHMLPVGAFKQINFMGSGIQIDIYPESMPLSDMIAPKCT